LILRFFIDYRITAGILDCMAKQIKENDNPLLLDQVHLIREELNSLHDGVNRIELQLNDSQSGTEKVAKHLKIFVAKTGEGRKPYIVYFNGLFETSLKLSSIRTAILLTLLQDLEDRSEGGKGSPDPLETISKSYHALEPQAIDDEKLTKNLRVALYRFDIFLAESKQFVRGDFALRFDDSTLRLNLVNNKKKENQNSLTIEIETNDREIGILLDQTFSTSPLAQIRKHKMSNYPPCKENSQKLVGELFNHNFPLIENILFFRPTLPTLTTDLLESFKFNDAVAEHVNVYWEGCRTKRVHSINIISEGSLWDLIKLDPELGFILYEKDINSKQVENHICNIIDLLENFEKFEIIVPSYPIVMNVGNYEMSSSSIPEYFTVFYGKFQPDRFSGTSYFAVNNPLAYQGIANNVVNPIINHPTTIADKGKVIDLFREILNHLVEKGPIHSEKKP